MVRRVVDVGTEIPGFPRPRGDGPFSRWAAARRPEVPPPTRGWSPTPVIEWWSIMGSPAHAGMVPSSPVELSSSRGFPRPRGDGPIRRGRDRDLAQVPPPTRGWSQGSGRCARPDIGSPAHAGMVPWMRAPMSMATWFPRPRGDGPWHGLPCGDRDGVPPPTRGWSHWRPGR